MGNLTSSTHIVRSNDVRTSGLLSKSVPRKISPIHNSNVTSDILIGLHGSIQVISYNKSSSLVGEIKREENNNRHKSPLSRMIINAHKKQVNKIIQLSSHRICTCSSDGSVKIFNMKTQKVEAEFLDHEGTVWDVCQIPNTSYDKIASCGEDGTVRVYNVDYQYCERTFHFHKDSVFSVDVFSETHLISASKDGSLRLEDYQYGGVSKTIELNTIPYSIGIFRKLSSVDNEDFSSSSEGTKVAVGCENGSIMIVQPFPNGEILHVVQTKMLITNIEIMSDFSLLSSHVNGVVNHYSFSNDSNELIFKNQYLHQNGTAINSTCKVGEDRFMSGGGNLVKIFNLRSGSCERWISIKGNKRVRSMLFLSEDIQKLRFVPSYNKTRLSFLLTEDYSNNEKDSPLIVRFKNGKQYSLPKSLVSICSDMSIPDDGKEFNMELLDYEPRVPRELIFKILLGIDEVNLNVRDYFGLFCLFDRLGMKKSMYVICRKLESLLDLKDLFVLFLCSVECYEQENSRGYELGSSEDPSKLVDCVFSEVEEEESITFQSVFTLTLFNIFKSRFSEINNEHGYARFLEKINYFDKLRRFKQRSIYNHPNLGFEIVPSFCSFYEIFTDNLVKLFDDEKYSNLLLKTKDGKTIRVHRSIVIFRSNFFYKMMEFKGSESRNNVVHIEFLDYFELKILIRYMYLDQLVDDASLKQLLKLLIHSEMYFEFQLKSLLKERIHRKMTEVFKNKTIEMKLLEIGYLLFNLPDIIRIDFIQLWSKKFGMREELLFNLVNYSKKVNDEIFEKDIQIKNLIQSSRKRSRDGSTSPTEEEVENTKNDLPFPKRRKFE